MGVVKITTFSIAIFLCQVWIVSNSKITSFFKHFFYVKYRARDIGNSHQIVIDLNRDSYESPNILVNVSISLLFESKKLHLFYLFIYFLAKHP